MTLTLIGFDPTELDEPWRKTDLVRISTEILEKIQKYFNKSLASFLKQALRLGN